jgi:hypothetical protein
MFVMSMDLVLLKILQSIMMTVPKFLGLYYYLVYFYAHVCKDIFLACPSVCLSICKVFEVGHIS